MEVHKVKAQRSKEIHRGLQTTQSIRKTNFLKRTSHPEENYIIKESKQRDSHKEIVKLSKSTRKVLLSKKGSREFSTVM